MNYSVQNDYSEKYTELSNSVAQHTENGLLLWKFVFMLVTNIKKEAQMSYIYIYILHRYILR